MKTNFSPLTYGYKFPNRFEYSGFKKIFKIIKNNLIYGMCGGMVFTALDFYFDQKSIPKYTNPNDIPLSYTKYLWKRQRESVSFLTFIKLITYALFPLSISINKSIQQELPQILEKLSDALPAPIIIVRSSFFQNPTNNHQVLVTQSESKRDIVKLYLYDPNYPNTEQFIDINTGSERSIIQSSGEPIRGFFLNHYVYKNSEDNLCD